VPLRNYSLTHSFFGWFVSSLIRYQTYQRDILKMNEPVLMQIVTSVEV